jgi:SulP family sulfate permease
LPRSDTACFFLILQLNEVVQWLNVLNPDTLIKLTALAVTTLMFMWVMHRFHHPLVLPVALAAVPLIFHMLLFTSGLNLEQAQEAGWVMKPTVSLRRYHLIVPGGPIDVI